MTVFVDYAQILLDFQTMLAAAGLVDTNSRALTVFKNADDVAFEYGNMPMADCRFRRNVPALVTIGQSYYCDLTIEVEIATYSMTSRDKCATMRDDLTGKIQRFFQQNPRFSAAIDSTIVGAVEFETTETKAQGEFVAAAVAQFHIQLYSQ